MAHLILNTNHTLLNDGSGTRVDDRSGNVSALDLSLSSPDIASNFTWGVYDDSLGSDHFPICLSYTVHGAAPVHIPRYNFKKADWGLFLRVADLDISGDDIDSKVHNITLSLTRAADIAIPKTSPVPLKYEVPWWTPACRLALRERNRLYRVFDKEPTHHNLISYKRARAQARRTIRAAKRDSWRSYVSTVNTDTPLGQVWSIIHRISRKRSRAPIPLLLSNGVTIDSPRDIANTLARSFAHTSSSANYHPDFQRRKAAAELQPLDFATEDPPSGYNTALTKGELLLALKSCKGKSPGPSGVTYDMLNHLSQSNLAKLLEVFNEIWATGSFPNSWRFSHVVPIPKKPGRLTDPSLFRPIALTDCLCKVMERIVNKRLLFFLESRGLLNNRQCGFRTHRSTLDHLVSLEHDTLQAFSRQHTLLATFLDLEKAYDMTWRWGILAKLHAFGLRGNLPVFIASFLKDRTFSVLLRSPTVISDIFVQENGVPQGSVLSPTLFLVMINDILSPASVPRNLKYSLYADDCALWHASPNAQFSAGRVQAALESIQRWAMQWGFKFSAAKSVAVVFTRSTKPVNVTFTLGGAAIPVRHSARFLGLHFDSRLNWKTHIEYLVLKCSRSLNVLKYLTGTSWGADRKSLLMIYKALIRSKLDYGSQVYASASEATLRRLDVIQNACLRVCLGALRCTRVERLEVEANVPPLRRRRDYLTLRYGLQTARKSTISSPACALLYDHHQFHRDCACLSARPAAVDDPASPAAVPAPPAMSCCRFRPLCVRLHFISTLAGVDVASVDRLVLRQLAPWEPSHIHVRTSWLPRRKLHAPVAELQQRFCDVLARYPACQHLYTDGSKTSECVGASVWSSECSLRYRLPLHTSVFAAELFAIDRAVDYALLTSPRGSFVICSDSKSALLAIEHGVTDSFELLGNLINKLESTRKTITLIWVPGHCNIRGNDQADALAKSASELGGVTFVPRELGPLLSLGKTSQFLLWQSRWTSLALPHAVKHSISDWATSYRTNRREEVVLARLRLNCTLVTHLQPYIARQFPAACPHCTSVLSIQHLLLHCPHYTPARRRLQFYISSRRLPFDLETLLSDDQDVVTALMIFLKESCLLEVM